MIEEEKGARTEPRKLVHGPTARYPGKSIGINTAVRLFYYKSPGSHHRSVCVT
jgi:hypothetical protein